MTPHFHGQENNTHTVPSYIRFVPRNIILLFLLSAFTLMAGFGVNANASEAPLIGHKDAETVYFFSYHCPGCLALNDFISLYDEHKQSVDLIRIPVFSDGSPWVVGAKIHILLNTLKATQDDSDIARSKLGFFLATSMADELISDNDFLRAFRVAGYDISDEDFAAAWRSLPIYLTSATAILNEARDEVGEDFRTPSVRVFSGGKVKWVFLDENAKSPGVKFVKELNGAFHDK